VPLPPADRLGETNNGGTVAVILSPLDTELTRWDYGSWRISKVEAWNALLAQVRPRDGALVESTLLVPGYPPFTTTTCGFGFGEGTDVRAWIETIFGSLVPAEHQR
jgi:hypothetical protein